MIMWATATEAYYGSNYAIQVGDDGPVKIGMTITGGAKSRLSQLQASSPYRLRVIVEWRGSAATEKELHLRLAPYRIRREWYHPVAPIFEAINEAIAVSHKREPDRLAFIEEFHRRTAPRHELRPDVFRSAGQAA